MSIAGTTVNSGRLTHALRTPATRGPGPRSDHPLNGDPLEQPDRPASFRMPESVAAEPALGLDRCLPAIVIVADRNRAIAELLAESLSQHAWVDGTRICDTVAEALQWIDGAMAPLVVSEVSLTDQTGVHLAQEVRRRSPSAKIAIWADRLHDSVLNQLVQIPVQGCFLKQDSLASLQAGLAVIAQGQSHFPASVRQRFIGGVARPGAVRSVATLKKFSPRHFTVLLRLAEGDSVKTIADALGVSVKTIDCLKYRIMKQLHLHDRVELARWAICEGLITA